MEQLETIKNRNKQEITERIVNIASYTGSLRYFEKSSAFIVRVCVFFSSDVLCQKNPLETFPRSFAWKLSKFLRTCYRETGAMDFGLYCLKNKFCMLPLARYSQESKTQNSFWNVFC